MAQARREYSGTPLPTKLGIRGDARVYLGGAPAGFDAVLGPLPAGVQRLERPARPLDVAVRFVTRRHDLADRFPRLAAALAPAGRLWIAWPKKASRIATDLDFGAVQGIGLAAGLVDNKSASITDDFQGLQFVVRREDRRR